ncbi:MAG: sigma-70 family RNA polymerase sigma factor [Edaphobacter sp.]|jgi:RNA polymerase sigma-70 factor, ECF subfamily
MDATERVFALPLLGARRTLASGAVALSSTPVDSDEELIERIRKQDDDALLALFQRYKRLALMIGGRVLRDPGEAEDLVQDVFLRLHSGDISFDSTKGSARTWMVQMIHRRAFDRRDYLTRRRFYDGTDELGYTNAISEVKNPEDDVIDRLTAQQLREAFGELNDKQRETLELFFFEGYTLMEIAQRTNAEVSNVRHHYYRGLERLRVEVRELLGSERNKR